MTSSHLPLVLLLGADIDVAFLLFRLSLALPNDTVQLTTKPWNPAYAMQ